MFRLPGFITQIVACYCPALSSDAKQDINKQKTIETAVPVHTKPQKFSIRNNGNEIVAGLSQKPFNYKELFTIQFAHEEHCRGVAMPCAREDEMVMNEAGWEDLHRI